MFQIMDGWDWALLAVGAYIAVFSLSRLMAHRRDKLTAQFLAELALKRWHERQPAETKEEQTQANKPARDSTAA